MYVPTQVVSLVSIAVSGLVTFQFSVCADDGSMGGSHVWVCGWHGTSWIVLGNRLTMISIKYQAGGWAIMGAFQSILNATLFHC